MLKRTCIIYKQKINKIRQKLSQKQKRDIWADHIVRCVGKDAAINFGKLPCYVCEKTMIDPFDFEGGHVISVAHGGNNCSENLRAICSLCNNTMQEDELYEFKSRLHGKIHYDNRLSETQKSVMEYYDYVNENLSHNLYYNNFYDWANIILKSMSVKTKWNNGFLENNVKCNCNYKFAYVTGKDYLPLTCKDTRQNIAHVLHDHIHCNIHNKRFTDATISSPSFIGWTSNRFYRLDK